MKLSVILITLTTMATLTMTTAAEADKAPSLSGSVKVDGLSCPFCAYGLQKKLNALAWIRSSKIFVDAGRADFQVKPKKVPDINALRQAVKRGGFTPRAIVLTAKGQVVKKPSGVILIELGGVALLLSPSSKLTKLLAKLGTGKRKVRVKGAATTSGTTTTLTVQSYQIL